MALGEAGPIIYTFRYIYGPATARTARNYPATESMLYEFSDRTVTQDWTHEISMDYLISPRRPRNRPAVLRTSEGHVPPSDVGAPAAATATSLA